MVETMMRAVRFHGKTDIRLETIAVPKCGKDQVKIKPAFVGICGTDLHEYLHGAYLIPQIPHPATGEALPVVMGHEFSGVIEECGEDVKGFAVGEKVVVQPILYDGTCASCEDGLINCCSTGGFIGLSGLGGGLSEHIVVPVYAVFKLPNHISLEIGALVEPLAVAWHAVKMSSFRKGDSALVIGGGPIGIAVVQILKASGAKNIIVSEISTLRRKFALDFGAQTILDPTKDNVVDHCRKVCDGQGVHVAFDAAGAQAGLDAAVNAVRARGMIVNIAIWEQRATIHPNLLVLKERVYLGVATYQKDDFQEVIDAISSGVLDPKGMITAVIELEDVEERGFKALINDKEKYVKILVRAFGRNSLSSYALQPPPSSL